MKQLQPGDPRDVGPYRLEHRLGGGGMGQVFLGRSRGGRPVAVKVVRPELAEAREFRRRFALEVEAVRRVGGFYAAQVVDADTDADPPWLVTAYVPGPSLHEAVKRHGPLPPEATAKLGAGLAEGLAAIHDCELVHRDLKPSNVILADDGPRVIDFGIARALDATSHTVTRAVVGTASFMSPEQARGGVVGPPSDVFSLGVVLAFAAVGRTPFGVGSPTAVIYRIVHDEPDLTGVPASLADLAGACLAKDPRDRPGVGDILDRLAEPALDGTRWLPPEVTTMVTERRAAARVQTAPLPGTEPVQGGGARPPGTTTHLAFDAPRAITPPPAYTVTFTENRITSVVKSCAIGLAIPVVLGLMTLAGLLASGSYTANWSGLAIFLMVCGLGLGAVFTKAALSFRLATFTLDSTGLTFDPGSAPYRLRQRRAVDWDVLDRVGMVGDRRRTRIVVWYGGEWNSSSAGREGQGGDLVCKPWLVTGRRELPELRAALKRFAGDRYAEHPAGLPRRDR
ncbi:serine/threonine-protein kinase [Actinomadura sp. 7K507]|uniref:serine/threonine-protein kinase n=1 Tax=Actinomadura sp. 7K507 TaxID=2530365 RepID=UPI0010466E25|nr:serine/threonine-protein kinase [Actinomadura sp. 7K507]TDC81631.1 serine/threonine protein kinase [Actinomadura sp. 7K507]